MSLRSKIAAVIAAGSLLLWPTLTHAQHSGGSCAASPNPAAVGQHVTVTASGLQPNTYYMTTVVEPTTDSYTVGTTTDASGSAVWTDGYALNVAGTYTINWYTTMREAMHNHPEASCTATAQ
jgi:hypothetical protein